MKRDCPSNLVDEIPIELPDDWTRYVDEPLTEKEMVKIRSCVNRQSLYGEEDWQGKVSKVLGLESTLRTRGRPRKGAKKKKK